MLRQFWPRLLLALLVAIAGGGWALLAGAPVDATLVSLLGGALAVALVAAVLNDGPAEAAPAPEAGPAGLSVRDVVEAIDEPVLLVRARRIAMANAEARVVLGARIEGEDVRVAIRHPAAAERLLEGAERPSSRDGAELVGVGAPERRWTMSVSDLADGSRLVRLEDRSQVHAAERMRTDFVANASHELRTPLATLLGFIETLASTDAGEDGATRARFLGIMQREARRIQQLVDDLISLSRIESERFTAPRDRVRLRAVVEQAVANQAFLAEERGSPVVLEVAENLPAVTGDEPQLTQLLDNLLGNALKYGRPGEPVTVGAHLLPGGQMVRLSVRDRGEGIAKVHLPRLTERFYRVDPSRSRAIGGTGLGLSIVKHIAERHRGRLTFHSEVGEGTTVCVDLPVATDPVSLSPNRHELVATGVGAPSMTSAAGTG